METSPSSAPLLLRTEARLAVGGEGIARAPDGRVVFVRRAAPDELVRARLTKLNKRHARFEVVEVCSPGPARVEPPCRYASRCGGCPLMHLEPRAAAHAKLDAGLEALARIGGLAPRTLAGVPLWRAPASGARTRARLAVVAGQVGFRAARSHAVVPVEHCLVLHPRLEEARAALAQVALRQPIPGEHEVELITDGDAVAARLPAALAPLAPALEGAGVRATGDAPLEVIDEAGRLLLRPEVFAQASLQGNAALLRAVSDLTAERGTLAAELYAGSGNFTRLLAARYRRVVAVERAGPAVTLGEALGLANVEWRRADAAEGLEPGAELVLVDPPRSGLEPALLEALVASPPPRLVYVSCDVGTLARDLRALERGGLRVEALRAFDLYPHTPHLEWVVALRVASA